jgi:hypothetical protein
MKDQASLTTKMDSLAISTLPKQPPFFLTILNFDIRFLIYQHLPRETHHLINLAEPNRSYGLRAVSQVCQQLQTEFQTLQDHHPNWKIPHQPVILGLDYCNRSTLSLSSCLSKWRNSIELLSREHVLSLISDINIQLDSSLPFDEELLENLDLSGMTSLQNISFIIWDEDGRDITEIIRWLGKIWSVIKLQVDRVGCLGYRCFYGCKGKKEVSILCQIIGRNGEEGGVKRIVLDLSIPVRTLYKAEDVYASVGD